MDVRSGGKGCPVWSPCFMDPLRGGRGGRSRPGTADARQASSSGAPRRARARPAERECLSSHAGYRYRFDRFDFDVARHFGRGLRGYVGASARVAPLRRHSYSLSGISILPERQAGGAGAGSGGGAGPGEGPGASLPGPEREAGSEPRRPGTRPCTTLTYS